VKNLQFTGDTAVTPFGRYTIISLNEGEHRPFLLQFPDKTTKTFSHGEAARYYANAHWLHNLALCIEQPLLCLLSTPGKWRAPVTTGDLGPLTLGHIHYEMSLAQMVAICYLHEQKEVTQIILEYFSPVKMPSLTLNSISKYITLPQIIEGITRLAL
jgi:hypothetical protein